MKHTAEAYSSGVDKLGQLQEALNIATPRELTLSQFPPKKNVIFKVANWEGQLPVDGSEILTSWGYRLVVYPIIYILFCKSYVVFSPDFFHLRSNPTKWIELERNLIVNISAPNQQENIALNFMKK